MLHESDLSNVDTVWGLIETQDEGMEQALYAMNDKTLRRERENDKTKELPIRHTRQLMSNLLLEREKYEEIKAIA